MSLELRPLRHLLAIVAYGSLGRAAAALNMTQPALSRSVKALEEEVGTELFLRSASGVTPTAEARLLIEGAKKIVDAAEELDRELDRRRVPDAGQITFGAGASAQEMIVPDALARFVDVHPLVRVRVLAPDWESLPRRLRAREIDFFVTEFGIFQGEHDLDIETVRQHQLYFVARRDHPLADRGDFEIADLFSYPLVGVGRYPKRGLAPILAARPQEAVRRGRPFPQVELSSIAAVKRTLKACDGIAPLPLSAVADELASGDLAILASPPWAFLAYAIVRLKAHHLSVVATRLIDSLREAAVACSEEEERLAAAMLPAAEARSRAGPGPAGPASAPTRPSPPQRSGA
jgi:DNA-binding transcriptional LysR family regulator